MQRYLIIAIIAVLFFMVCYVSVVSLAQEEGYMEYSWGQVSDITPNQIVITEYDYDKDQEVRVTYDIDLNTEFINIDSFKDIVIGDDVEIDYVEEGNKNLAKTISVERTSQEEYMPKEMDQWQDDYSMNE